MDVTDIVKSFISPLFTTTVLFIIGQLLNWVFLRKTFPHGGGADTKTGHFLRKYTKLILFIWLSLIATLLLTSDDPYRWISAVWMLLPVFSVPVMESGLLSATIPDRNLRVTILTILTTIPLLSFATGKKEAELIFKNEKFTTIDVETIKQVRPTDTTTYKFLGLAGDFVFGVSVDNKTTLMIPKDGLRDIVTHK
jgi:hypothetical protein